MAAMSFSGGGFEVDNVRFEDCDVGIRVRNGRGTINGAEFKNVRLPYDIQNSSLEVTGSRISRDPKLPRNSGRNTSFSGWTRPKGPPLPAFCPACKSIFPSRNYNVESSLFYSRDNEECCPFPNCRNEHAKLSDGLFRLTESAVEIISGPDMSYAALAAINQAASKILREGIDDPEKAERTLGEANKVLGFSIKQAFQICSAAGFFFTAALQVASYLEDRKQTLLAQQQLDVDRQQLEQDQEQTRLAQQQLDVDRQQLELQKQDQRSSEELLAKTLEILSKLSVTITPQARAAKDTNARPTASPPSASSRSSAPSPS